MVTGSRMSAQNIIFLDKVRVHPNRLVSTPTMGLTPQLNETEETEGAFVLLATRKQRIKDDGHNSVELKAVVLGGCLERFLQSVQSDD